MLLIDWRKKVSLFYRTCYREPFLGCCCAEVYFAVDGVYLGRSFVAVCVVGNIHGADSVCLTKYVT